MKAKVAHMWKVGSIAAMARCPVRPLQTSPGRTWDAGVGPATDKRCTTFGRATFGCGADPGRSTMIRPRATEIDHGTATLRTRRQGRPAFQPLLLAYPHGAGAQAAGGRDGAGQV